VRAAASTISSAIDCGRVSVGHLALGGTPAA
jgi:hypothetical protein